MFSRNRSSVLSIVLVLMLIFGQTSVYATNYNDTNEHWAKNEIQKWSDKGLLKGNEGKFNPDQNITVAEMAVILDRLMDYQETGKNTFLDLDENWYTEAILKNANVGVFDTNDTNITPMAIVTREEAVGMLSKAIGLDGTDGSTSFLDDASIKPEYRGYVKAFSNNGYIKGMPDGTFAPKASLTRATIVKIIDNILSEWITVGGTYTSDYDGSVIINKSGVTLKDLTINGNLIVSEGVGSGEVYLDNVKVMGNIKIRGGGENSIYFNDTTVEGSLIVKKSDGKIRIVASGSTELKVTKLASGAMLVENKLKGKGFQSVIVPADAVKNSTILFKGDFTDIDIQGDNAKIELDKSSSIDKLNVHEDVDLDINGELNSLNLLGDAGDVSVNGSGEISNVNVKTENANIAVEKDIEINRFEISAKDVDLECKGTIKDVTATKDADEFKLKGTGAVKNVYIKADNAKVDTKGTTVKVSKGVSGVKAGGSNVKAGKTQTTSGRPSTGDKSIIKKPSSGGSSSSNNHSNNNNPTPTPTPTPSDASIVATSKGLLTINGDLDNVIEDITLPTSLNGVNISWATSDDNYIDTTGKVTVPIYGTGSHHISLTATLTKGNASDTKVFNLTVPEPDDPELGIAYFIANHEGTQSSAGSKQKRVFEVTGTVTIPETNIVLTFKDEITDNTITLEYTTDPASETETAPTPDPAPDPEPVPVSNPTEEEAPSTDGDTATEEPTESDSNKGDIETDDESTTTDSDDDTTNTESTDNTDIADDKTTDTESVTEDDEISTGDDTTTTDKDSTTESDSTTVTEESPDTDKETAVEENTDTKDDSIPVESEEPTDAPKDAAPEEPIEKNTVNDDLKSSTINYYHYPVSKVLNESYESVDDKSEKNNALYSISAEDIAAELVNNATNDEYWIVSADGAKIIFERKEIGTSHSTLFNYNDSELSYQHVTSDSVEGTKASEGTPQTYMITFDSGAAKDCAISLKLDFADIEYKSDPILLKGTTNTLTHLLEQLDDHSFLEDIVGWTYSIDLENNTILLTSNVVGGAIPINFDYTYGFTPTQDLASYSIPEIKAINNITSTTTPERPAFHDVYYDLVDITSFKTSVKQVEDPCDVNLSSFNEGAKIYAYVVNNSEEILNNFECATRSENYYIVDNTSPELLVADGKLVALNINDSYEQSSVTATDNLDKDINAKIVTTITDHGVILDSIDTSQVGEYIVTYNVTDWAGNKADNLTQTIIISDGLSSVAELSNVSAFIGTDEENISFPNIVTVNLLSGNTASIDIESITWACDNYDSNTPGLYTFRGTGFTLPDCITYTGTVSLDSMVSVLVEVKEKSNIEAEALMNVLVELGTPVDAISYPNYIRLQVSDDKVVSADISSVHWVCDTYDANTLGSYTFTGTFILPDELPNTNGEVLDLELTVTVNEHSNLHTVRFITKDNDIKFNDMFVEHNKKIKIPTVYRYGYKTYGQWSKKMDLSDSVYRDLIITEDTDLYLNLQLEDGMELDMLNYKDSRFADGYPKVKIEDDRIKLYVKLNSPDDAIVSAIYKPYADTLVCDTRGIIDGHGGING